MSTNEWNATEVRDKKFQLLIEAIRRRLLDVSRDANAVLDVRPDYLKIRFLVDASPQYLAFELEDSDLLESSFDPERVADIMVREWQENERTASKKEDGQTP